MLPSTPGALGNPTKLFLDQGTSPNQVLGVKGGSSHGTEPESGSSGQTWRFQLVGWIAMLTQTSQILPTFPQGNPSGLLQKMPVYKIINYHADGTHTCLDGTGGNPTAGTMIDSYGVTPTRSTRPTSSGSPGIPGIPTPCWTSSVNR